MFNISSFIVNRIASLPIVSFKLRRKTYKLFGLEIGDSLISPGCFFGNIKHYSKIKIGNNVFINYNCFFDTSSDIEIGDNCAIAMDVMICTGTHAIGDEKQRTGSFISQPVKINNGCWIGTRATILPGVNIGNGCVIAAGSVVIKDCKPNSLYAGVPAKFIKDLK